MNEDNDFDNDDFNRQDRDPDRDEDRGKGGQSNFPNNNNNFRNIALIVGAIILSLILFQTLFNSPSAQDEISYTEFLRQVENQRIRKVTIKGGMINGTYKSGGTFVTRGPTETTDYLEKLRSQGVNITFKEASDSNWFFSLLISLLPVLLIVGLWVFMMRKMQGNNALNFGESQADLVNKEFSDVSFDDFAGVEEVREEVEEIVEYLKNPEVQETRSRSSKRNDSCWSSWYG